MNLSSFLRLRLGWGLTALLAFSSPARGEAPAAPESFEVTAVEAYLAGQVKAKGLTGLSVAVVQDGQLKLARSYGVRSLETREPLTTNTLLAIGSVTKQFTCACVLLLAEQGKLSVRDRVSQYFPNLTRARDITLLDLMQHVSGYHDYYPLDFVDARMATPISPDALIQQYAGAPLDFEPGSRYSYSNTGYEILGRVVEKVSGESFGAFLGRHILGPLGLRHTVYEPAAPGPELAQGYASFALGPFEAAKPEARGWLAAAGAINSTASDLAAWDLALLDGRVLKPESLRTMTERRTLTDGRLSDYGCGLRIVVQDGLTVLKHNGAVAGYLAYNAMIPATRSAVVVLSNCEEETALANLHATLLSLLTRQPARLPKIAGPPADQAARAFWSRLQAGEVVRAELGEEFSAFLTPEKLQGAAARLKPFGAPKKVTLERLSERGGMEVSTLRFTFDSGPLSGLMYRSPDGRIQQFFIRKE